MDKRSLASVWNRSPKPAAPGPLHKVHKRSNTAKGVLLILALMFGAVVSGFLVVIAGWFSLILFVVLALFALLLYDFRIGVVALMIFIPLSSIKFMPSFNGLNAQNFLIFGTTLSYLLHRMNEKVQYRLLDKQLVLFYLLPFLLVGLWGSNYAHILGELSDKAEEAVGTRSGFILHVVIKPALLIVLGWLIAAGVRESRNPVRFITALAFGAIVPALFIIVYVPAAGISLSDLVYYRSFLSALGMHANQFAVVLNFGIAVSLFTALESPHTGRRTFLLIVTAMLVGTLMLTFSRGGYLSLALIFLCYVVYYRDPSKLFIALLVLAIGAFFIPDAVIERITLGVTHGSHDELSSGRLDGIWAPLLPKVLESPVWGHGLLYVGRSDLVASGRMMPVSQAHNAYLDLLLDSGLLGTTLVLMFFHSAYKKFKTLGKEDPDPIFRGFFRGASVGLLALLLQAFTDDRLFPNTPQMLFWMAYGIMLGRNPAMLKQKRKTLVGEEDTLPLTRPASL